MKRLLVKEAGRLVYFVFNMEPQPNACSSIIYIYTCFSLHLQVIFRAVEQISTGLSVCQSLFLTKTLSLQLSACL